MKSRLKDLAEKYGGKFEAGSSTLKFKNDESYDCEDKITIPFKDAKEFMKAIGFPDEIPDRQGQGYLRELISHTEDLKPEQKNKIEKVLL